MSPRAESIARRIAADLEDLAMLADAEPNDAHAIELAIVAKLREREQIRSLSEQVIQDIPWPDEDEMRRINARNIAEAAAERIARGVRE